MRSLAPRVPSAARPRPAAPRHRRAPAPAPRASAADDDEPHPSHAAYANASSHELDALLAELRSRQRGRPLSASAPSAQPRSDTTTTTTTSGGGGGGSLSSSVGTVHLVGTGPGDPGLLTLGALRLMQTADVVLYDRLVTPEVLELVGPSARMVYVGKAAGFHTRTQAEIEALLQTFAHAGARVVRLKGGDPFVFGRGGEEAAALRSAGVPVAVQPGVTAGAGIAAELGVPLTHRGLATSVRFLTGHERPTASPAPSSASTSPPPGPLFGPADAMSTLVVYMGLATLPSLVAALTGGGDEGPLDGATPAVAVERGTTPQQRRVFARLSSLAEGAAACGLQSPTLLLVGRCVALSPLWPPGLGDAAAHPRGWELQCGPPDADEAAAQAAEARAVVLPGRAAAAASAAPGGGGSGERLVLPARAAARDAAGATLSPWR